MFKSEDLKKYLDFAHEAYQKHNVTNQAYRQDGKVPYLMHPLWCAAMLIADTQVPFEQRELGAKALILHDVLEDTSLMLPDWVEPEVRKTVEAMTYKSFEEGLEKYEEKTPFLKLLNLYDKLASMYERHIPDDIKSTWKKLVLKNIEDMEKEYGNIRIVQVGKAIAENTDW